MKRLISAILAISITASIAKPVKANPAAAIPLTLCSTGVGCVLVGTAIIGGVVVYIWRKQQGKKTYAIQSTEDGQVLAHWDVEKENRHTVWGDATLCHKMGKKNGWKLKRIEGGNGEYTCIFHGKQTSFGG